MKKLQKEKREKINCRNDEQFKKVKTNPKKSKKEKRELGYFSKNRTENFDIYRIISIVRKHHNDIVFSYFDELIYYFNTALRIVILFYSYLSVVIGSRLCKLLVESVLVLFIKE